MNDMKLLWVLGHKIRLMDTNDSYGLIEVTSAQSAGTATALSQE
jgi:hypothetical protein